MRADEIRKRYLEFFEKKGHKIVPSASLVPENDPTTLFTGSGMQPMLQYFLGTPHPLGSRIADSQKCFRSQDIEEVGDNRHTTFFEMLGNWSFGDYFKEEQIAWMFAFLRDELKLDLQRIYFTCYTGNDELGIPRDEKSALLWQHLLKEAGVSASIAEKAESLGLQDARIFYYGDKKNWWSRVGSPENMPVGEPGGPDTEMFWDFGEKLGLHEVSRWKDEPCHVNCDCGRFMEIGNNVFMEYVKKETGFEKLSKPNVDFGGGLERLAAAVRNNHDMLLIDCFDSARNLLETLSGMKYGENGSETFAFRVILDHMRAATFLIGDSVVPSNKDQGYFVRRLIRRSIRHAKKLGIERNFAKAVGESFIDTYQEAYPSLAQKKEGVLLELEREESKFRTTLEKGLREFEKRSQENSFSGKDAFDLFTTYGFPLELTEELLVEKGRSLDKKAFEEEFRKHRDLSRTASAGKFKGGLADASEKTTMLHTSTHLMLAGLRKYLGNNVHQAGSNITEERTRFDFTYPEKVPREILDKVEAYVNEAIAKEASVVTEIMSKDEAKARGVEGSFWEKYPEQVTVYLVKAPDGTVYSQELCGGPHVKSAADIQGKFKIVKEEASSAGIRRIKAILE